MTTAQTNPRKWHRVLIVLLMAAMLLIALLLLGLAVYYALPFKPDAVNHGAAAGREIMHMDVALKAFKAKYGMYPPSKIKLCSNAKNYDPTNPLDVESLADVSRIWPALGDFKGIAWDGAELPAEGVILEGDQCLVFFLGGIPSAAAEGPPHLGFAVDPKNPVAADGRHVGPLFWFDWERLVKLRGNRFPSYLDQFGQSQPYAYFCAGNRRDGYNRFGTSDCASLGVWPYAESLQPQPRYFNPHTFQIISAGPDGQFGPGTVLPDGRTWSPATADQIDPAGRDDLSNFYSAPLGVREP
jgi:general secretion pathway protein G